MDLDIEVTEVVIVWNGADAGDTVRMRSAILNYSDASPGPENVRLG